MWPFRSKSKARPLPIPKFDIGSHKAEPTPEPVEVHEAPGEFGMETIKMKIRRYWRLGE